MPHRPRAVQSAAAALHVLGLAVAACALSGCASSLEVAQELPVTTQSLAEPKAAQPAPPAAGSGQAAAGTVASDAARAAPSGADKPAAGASPDELYIDFDGTAITLSDREQSSLRQAVAARMLAGGVKTRIRISAGRGGSGNLFEQAKFAEKRARSIKEMLPPKVVEAIEFDPSLPEDTVRLEFRKS